MPTVTETPTMNKCLARLLLAFSAAALIGGLAGCHQPAVSSAYQWRKADAAIALLSHDKPVWQLNYAKDRGAPYFDPVNLADGTELVWCSPPDHPHHRALWFAWKMLNGVNYWEHAPDSGVTEVTDAKITTRPDSSALIRLTLSYHPKDQPAVLAEQRVISVSPPAADGSYKMDWTATFTAGQADVELRGGTAGGGYAGLSARMSKDSRDWLLVNSEGRRADQAPADGLPPGLHGQHARWADFSLVSTLTGTIAGLTIFDHPANLRYPSQWHDCMYPSGQFAYFSPAPLWSEPYTLAAGKELTLRYHILVHAGRPDPTTIEREFKAFSAAR